MTWHEVLITAESAAVSAVVFITMGAVIGYVVAKVKLIPLFRKHKAELMAALWGPPGGENDGNA